MLISEHLTAAIHLDLHRKGSDGEAISDGSNEEILFIL